MTTEIIKYINQELNIDIRKKHKSNEYVFGRIIYYKLASELTNLCKRNIGKAVNKDHCAVIHNLKNFHDITQRPAFKKIYDTFREYPIEEDRTEYTEVVRLNNQIRLELIGIKQKYDQLLKKTLRDVSKFELLLHELNENELDTVYVRLEAIVKMTKSARM